MPDKDTEKIIGGAVDISLANEFDSQVFGRRFTKKTLFKAFAKWWISLPEDEQKRFYALADDERTESFSTWVERIIDEHITARMGTLSTPSPEARPDMVEFIENLTYYVRYKLPSPAEQKELRALYRALAREFPHKKKTRKKTAS